MKRRLACLVPVALALGLGAGAAQSASLQERFRVYLDRLKARRSDGMQALNRSLGMGEVRQPELVRRTDSLPLGRREYVLFVADGCRSCEAWVQRAREAAGRGEGDVTVMNISRDPTARESFALVGAPGVPTMLIGRYRLSGYSDALYKQAKVREATESALDIGGGA